MEISKLLRDRQAAAINVKQTMKPGQIVRANIIKLYSNGRAHISMGNQQLIAQLEAALAVGKSYHFQVLQTDGNTIHLKVLSEVSKDQNVDLKSLLRYFNFPEAKYKLNFLKTLIDGQVSFERSELQEAFQILKGVPNEQEAHSILKQMIIRGLPITGNVFSALQTINQTDLTTLLGQVNQLVNQSPLESLTEMKTLLNKPQEQLKQLLIHKITQNNEISSLFQRLGLQIKSKDLILLNEIGKPLSGNQLFSAINNFVNSMIDNERILVERATNLMGKLQTLQAIHNSEENDLAINNFKQQFNNEIIPLLSKEHRIIFSDIISTSKFTKKDLVMLANLLKTLSSEHTYSQINRFKSILNYDIPKEQLLLDLKQNVRDMGLNYEYEMLNNNFKDSNQTTLKGQILQLLNTAEFANNEQIQQVLHFINGAQIHSVQETNHFIQANLIILGKQFEFNKDLYINFESRKTKEGKIDPDFCRILFYLDLNVLKEIVIDMNIQDRFISINVYNELPNLLNTLSKGYEQKLKTSLEKLNYTLSKISFSPFEKPSKPQRFSLKESQSKEGIDFKI